MERRTALKLSAGFLGYSLSGIVFSSMLNGCKVDAGEDWTPLFFTKAQANTLAEMAEHFLPKTDTAGAKDVLVHRFMDKLISKCYNSKAQSKFIAEFNDFQWQCKSQTGHSFEECSKDERDAIYTAQEETPYIPAMYVWGNEMKEAVGGTSFYRQVKGLTLFGYFSSEEVGKNILKYDPVPGKFIGCLPLSEVGGTWTL